MELLLIHGHLLFGAGFGHALEAARPRVRVHWAPTLADGLALAAREAPLDAALDAALVDEHLAEGGGLAAISALGHRFPQLPRVLLTGRDVRGLAAPARAAGAASCLDKLLGAEAILAALDRVLCGGECFDPVPAGPAPDAPALAVTPRQMQVLDLVAQGRLNKQIADQLGIAERTVKLHVTALLQALAARNRTHLLVKARAHGLL